MTCLVIGFWQDNGAKYGDHLVEHDLTLTRTWLITPMIALRRWLVTHMVAPMGICCQASHCCSPQVIIMTDADFFSPVASIAPLRMKLPSHSQHDFSMF